MTKLVSFQNRVRLLPSGYLMVGTPTTNSDVGFGVDGVADGATVTVVVAVGVELKVGAAVAVEVAVAVTVDVDCWSAGVSDGSSKVWVGWAG